MSKAVKFPNGHLFESIFRYAARIGVNQWKQGEVEEGEEENEELEAKEFLGIDEDDGVDDERQQ